jgi:tetratricopeptide (TPR) repeat protein
MAFGRIPQKSDGVAHGFIILSAARARPCFLQIVPSSSPHQVAMLKFLLRLRILSMPDTNNRRKAEDIYYSALDLMAEGKLEEAVVAYRESIATDPGFTEAMHGLARALQDLQRYDEAIEAAKKISELDPDDVLAHTSLSVLYQKKGMIAEAEAEGAKARVLGWKQQLKKR